MTFIKEYINIEIDKDSSILVNLINGNADILEANIITEINKNNFENIPKQISEMLKDRGYLFDTEKNYNDFLDAFNSKLLTESKKTAPNFIYIPTYDCNLNCYYCFEKAYKKNNNTNGINVNSNINSFFNIVEQIRNELEIKNEKKYNDDEILITLTGGEPLLTEYYEIIEEFLRICKQKNYTVSIVTNGTTIKDYIELLIKYNITDIQITLDGDKNIHDSIRKYHNNSPTFEDIIQNIELLSRYSNNISVRINITKKNIQSIVGLEEIIEKYPNVLFYVYLLQQEGCSDYENVVSELEGLKYIYNLKKEHPILRARLVVAFHGYKVIDRIFYEKDYSPKIKVCTAMENQYIVDYSGNIYKCWWGMGNKDYSVGTIEDNKIFIDCLKTDIYKNRNIFNLKPCIQCKYRYICGGACSGRLTQSDLIDGKTMCPDFKNILNYVILQEYNLSLEL